MNPDSKGPEELREYLFDIVSTSRDIDLISDPEQVQILKEMLFSVTGQLANVSDSFVREIARHFLEFESISDKPPGAIRIINNNHFQSFSSILDLMKVPESARYEYFYRHYQGIYLPASEQSGLMVIYISLPVDPEQHKLFKEKLTRFKLLCANLLNINILRLDEVDRLIMILKTIAMMSDFYTLEYAIQRQEVHFGAVGEIYNAIDLRADYFIEKVLDIIDILEEETVNLDEVTMDLESIYKIDSDEV